MRRSFGADSSRLLRFADGRRAVDDALHRRERLDRGGAVTKALRSDRLRGRERLHRREAIAPGRHIARRRVRRRRRRVEPGRIRIASGRTLREVAGIAHDVQAGDLDRPHGRGLGREASLHLLHQRALEAEDSGGGRRLTNHGAQHVLTQLQHLVGDGLSLRLLELHRDLGSQRHRVARPEDDHPRRRLDVRFRPPERPKSHGS